MAVAFAGYGGKMKKILFGLLDLLAAAFLIGAYVIQYFTKRKLGMLRWVNHQRMKIQKAVPVDLLKYVAVALVLILVILVIVGYVKKRDELSRLAAVMTAVMVIIAVVYLGFTLFVNVESIRSYYLVLPMIGASSLMLVIRNSIAVWMCEDEK